jgi:hypothetical protein
MSASKILLILLSILIAVVIVSLRNQGREKARIETRESVATPTHSPVSTVSPMSSAPDEGFDPSSREKAIARAESILKKHAKASGIDRKALGEPRVRVGEASAQVFYKQNFEGAKVIPYGNVTVDLGPKGELLALDSDYVPEPRSENRRVLSAKEAMPASASGLETIVGAPVFFMAYPEAGSPGRHAYEYNIEGKQVLVDASNGQVIFQRDRRKY